MLRKLALPIFCLALGAQAPPAAEGGNELEDLLNTPISVASATVTTIREQPGIVSLVTRKEIAASGARDLLDILHMVPGLSFGKDVQGAVGAGIRGLWGYEGKVLLLVDGMELNDPLYGTSLFGHHLSADAIQKVEIIRGPGSAMYGGHAELAVINVVTRTNEDLNVGYFAQSLGRIEGTGGRRGTVAAIGGISPAGRFTLTLATSEAPRSNETYQDLQGNRFDMARQSGIRSLFASLGLEYVGVQGRLLMDSYHLDQREHFGSTIVPNVITQRFDSYGLDLRRRFKLSGTLTLTPSLQVRRQFPWAAEPTSTGGTVPFSSNKRVDRRVGGLQLAWDPGAAFSLLAGTERFTQKAERFFADGSPRALLADHQGAAHYAQGLLRSDLVNLTLGARFETHSQFESAFVPRLGLTKVFDRYHFKLLLSRAFRTPSIEGVRINPALRPEQTQSLEVEAGYQLSKAALVVLNVFDTTVKRPIIYFVDGDGNDAYANFDRMGTRGAELECRLQHGLGQALFSYSTYRNHGSRVPLYRVDGDDASLLAFPRQKAVLNSTFALGADYALFAGLVLLGPRWSWIYEAGRPQGRLDRLPATPLLTLSLTYKGVHPGLDLSLSLYNALKRPFGYAQAYGSWDVVSGAVTGFQPPLPGQPQEVALRLSYRP
jgi:outer membrane cobalamin receptor